MSHEASAEDGSARSRSLGRDALLDKDSPVPLYHQIRRHLSVHIARSADGELFPTEQEIAAHFGVSRPTVRQAISSLVQEGLLSRTAGKGTFVTNGRVQRDMRNAFETFDDEMYSSGHSGETEVEDVARIVSDAEISAQLGISPGEAVYRLSRRRLTDGLPLMTVVSFLPADLLPGFDTQRDRLRALRRTLEEVYGLCPEHVLRRLRATGASPAQARRLDVPSGSPIQYIETHAYLQTGRCIEFSRAWYRGDRSIFRVDIVRGQVAGSASAAVHSRKTDTLLTES